MGLFIHYPGDQAVKILLYRLRKLRGLKPKEGKWLIQAQWELARAQLRLRTTARGKMVFGRIPDSAAGPVLEEPELAHGLALAVERAAEHGIFRPKCLVRALALQALLERHGVHGGQVRIGVRMQDAAFHAHAWVEFGEIILGDRPAHVKTFVPVTGAQVRDVV
jgi:hypothetical protein